MNEDPVEEEFCGIVTANVSFCPITTLLNEIPDSVIKFSPSANTFDSESSVPERRYTTYKVALDLSDSSEVRNPSTRASIPVVSPLILVPTRAEI